MFISRRLAHKAQNHLTAILGFVELDRKLEATAEIRKLADLISSHTESADDEKERKRREDSEGFLNR